MGRAMSMRFALDYRCLIQLTPTASRLLVTWNKALFDTFIPRAWLNLLQLLSESVPDLDPTSYFHAWPSASQQVSGGDPFYWKDVGLNLIRVLAETQQEVWPVVGSDDFECVNTDQVLVAEKEDERFISALSAAGVDISWPPEGIVNMLHTVGQEGVILTPKRVHDVLVVTMFAFYDVF